VVIQTLPCVISERFDEFYGLKDESDSSAAQPRFYETYFGFDCDGKPDAEGCLHLTDADGFDLTLVARPRGLAFTVFPFRDRGR
jgi:hypothetical protein